MNSPSPDQTTRIVSFFKALHIDASVEDSLQLRAELRRRGFHFAIERVSTVEAFEAALDAHKWDLVISEYAIPAFTIEMALAAVARRKIDLPTIVLTRRNDDRALVDAMRAGARDFIRKDRPSDLFEAIERELQELEIRRRESAEQTSERLKREAPSIQAPLEPSGEVDPTLKGKETVLIVDDDPSFRDFVTWTFRRHGYHVIQAVDGQEAAYILEHYIERIDAMVSDVIMPNIDGIELAHHVVRHNPSVKVIMVSGHNEHPLDRGQRIAGRYPLIWKPFEITRLLRMMRDMLDEGRVPVPRAVAVPA
jgi:DNA-binding NtrC family response regulator